MKVKVEADQQSQAARSNLRVYASRKVRKAMKNVRHYIDEVVVKVRRGQATPAEGMNTCEIEVSIPGQNPLLIKRHEGNIYSAISRAVNRAANKAQRRISRRRFFSYKGRLKQFDRQLSAGAV